MPAVGVGGLVGVDQPRQQHPTISGLVAVEGELVEVGDVRATVRVHQLQAHEAREVHLQLRVAQAELLAQLASGEPDPLARHALLGGDRRDEPLERVEQPPRARGQLIERAAENLVRQSVREHDVLPGGLDVAHLLPVDVRGLPRPLMLMLMQQRDRPDQRQVLHVIAPRSRASVRERQPRRIGVDDRHRLQ